MKRLLSEKWLKERKTLDRWAELYGENRRFFGCETNRSLRRRLVARWTGYGKKDEG